MHAYYNFRGYFVIRQFHFLIFLTAKECMFTTICLDFPRHLLSIDIRTVLVYVQVYHFKMGNKYART